MGLSVLIVDDDEEICRLLYETLSSEGFRCDISSTAEDALCRLRSFNYDASLLDIKLPDKSGIELLESLGMVLQTTAIVMMTALNDVGTAVRAMQLGASSYLVKPFKIADLICGITSALEKMKKRDSLISMIQNSNDDVLRQESMSRINALALGVEARIELLDFHSQIVTKSTVSLAHQLGLPEGEIREWKRLRKEYTSNKYNYVKFLLDKLVLSPVAQVLFGVSRPINHHHRPEGERN